MENHSAPNTPSSSGNVAATSGKRSGAASRIRAVLAALKSGGWPAVLSCAAIALAVLHALDPKYTIDGTTIALLVVALLPWFKDVLKSIELPGGAKIQFNDVKSVTDTVLGVLEQWDRGKRTPPAAHFTRRGLLDERSGIDGGVDAAEIRGQILGNMGEPFGGGGRYMVRTDKENESMRRTREQVAALRAIAKDNPGMAFVGFGIEVEKKINVLFERSFPGQTRELKAGRKVAMLGQAGVLNRSLAYAIAELMRLRDHAARGAAVDFDAAEWLLDMGPDLLFELERSAGRESGAGTVFPHVETP